MVITGFDFRVFGNLCHVQVPFLRFFPKKVTIAINPVIQRNGENLHLVVLKNLLRRLAFQLVVNDLKTSVRFCNSKNSLQHFPDSFRTVNMQRHFSAQKPETRHQTGQTETMVAMKMRYKNMVDLGESRFCLS
ncbi:hypothetical protein SDC9_170852 [bioreactor metagenome]|uniref:Uncharacterized protein n=1 Tax=bioreactor metagenome TaxID=1076179 RepID=A0A645GHZ0_9ZZZZ